MTKPTWLKKSGARDRSDAQQGADLERLAQSESLAQAHVGRPQIAGDEDRPGAGEHRLTAAGHPG